MRKIALSLTLLAAALASVLSAVPAQAQNNRSFISGAGSDGNTCTFTSPCRNFQRAHDMTNPGGEINVLDPAGYGSLAITKAISIQGHGWGEAIGSGGAIAITINASAGEKVHIRGLIIEGFGTGSNGIVFTSGGSLSIQDCLIRNFTSNGIAFNPAASRSLSVSTTVVVGNGGTGIDIAPTGTNNFVTAAISRVELNDNGTHGFNVNAGLGTGTIRVSVSDSVANGNGSSGFRLASSAGHSTAQVMVIRSVSSNNFNGITSLDDAIGTVRVTQSSIKGNSNGFFRSGSAAIISYGDNNLDGNDADGSPTSTIGYH